MGEDRRLRKLKLQRKKLKSGPFHDAMSEAQWQKSTSDDDKYPMIFNPNGGGFPLVNLSSEKDRFIVVDLRGNVLDYVSTLHRVKEDCLYKYGWEDIRVFDSKTKEELDLNVLLDSVDAPVIDMENSNLQPEKQIFFRSAGSMKLTASAYRDAQEALKEKLKLDTLTSAPSENKIRTEVDRLVVSMEFPEEVGDILFDWASYYMKSPLSRISAINSLPMEFIFDEKSGGYFAFTQVEGSTKKCGKLVNRKGQWYVLSKEGKELFGPSTKEKAEKRLREIEYFKHHGAVDLGIDVESLRTAGMLYDFVDDILMPEFGVKHLAREAPVVEGFEINERVEFIRPCGSKGEGQIISTSQENGEIFAIVRDEEYGSYLKIPPKDVLKPLPFEGTVRQIVKASRIDSSVFSLGNSIRFLTKEGRRESGTIVEVSPLSDRYGVVRDPMGYTHLVMSDRVIVD